MPSFYPDDLLAELDNLHHVGHLENPDLILKETNASCGDEIAFYLTFERKKGLQLIKEVKWEGHGCSISQVSASLFANQMIGKSIPELLKFTQQNMEQLLGLENISLGRIKCLMLPLTALRQYEK